MRSRRHHAHLHANLCGLDKESATRTWKKTFGLHPLFCFLDNTHEALSGRLREGRAGSNTTADHITVLDQALAQIPDPHRYGTDILVRSDSAGCTYGFLTHIRSLRDQGVNTFFSVGVAIGETVRDAIRIAIDHPEQWVPALDSDGDLRDSAARLGIGVATVAGRHGNLTNKWNLASRLRGKISDEDVLTLEAAVRDLAA